MSLLTKYGDMNKVTATGLCVRYSCAEDQGWYVFTRYASKAYAYVGMTYDCAKTCAAAKQAQYLRTHNRVTINAQNVEGESADGTAAASIKIVADVPVIESLCSVTMVHGEGDSWDVEIQVNESEQRAAASASTSPASLFSAENSWDYDEGSAAAGAISLSSASGSTGGTEIETVVSSNLESFSPTSALLSVTFGTSSDTYTCRDAIKNDDGSWNVTWGGSLALTDAETIVKVSFGATTSNTLNFIPA